MSADLKPGDRFLDRFRVEHLAAEGGMASIYAATDEVTRHRVALKVLYPYYSDNAIIRTRFLEEGRIQQQLRHPNIIRVFAIQDVPILAILMEFVEGPTLDDFLASHGPLNTQEVIDVIIPVMSAVGFAHSEGVIHRDLKPSNILLPDGDLSRPKVLDFGVAKIKGGRHDLTATGTTVGTLHYMSPEQIVGSKAIDGRADIYSIGVTMYKLVTGEVPFNAPTEFALMMAQVEAAPLPPSRLRSGVSPELERVILKAMEKKPADRFQTIKEFTEELLSLRLSAERTVGETLSARVSNELLNYAIAASEIAYDRTDDDTFGHTDRIEAVSASLDQATAEIEATLKIDRRPAAGGVGERTAEVHNSAIVRLSGSDAALLDAQGETEAVPSLRERLKNTDPTRMTPPAELNKLLGRPPANDETTEKRERTKQVDVPAKLSGGLVAMSGSPNESLDIPTQPTGVAQPERTRPSKPSAIARESSLNPLSKGTQPIEAEDIDTVSVIRPLGTDELEAAGALRGGFHMADPQVDSQDLTAPKLSRDELKKMLPLALTPPGPSGPKMVLGKHYADTSERTREKPVQIPGLPPPSASTKGLPQPGTPIPQPSGPRPQYPPTGYPQGSEFQPQPGHGYPPAQQASGFQPSPQPNASGFQPSPQPNASGFQPTPQLNASGFQQPSIYPGGRSSGIQPTPPMPPQRIDRNVGPTLRDDKLQEAMRLSPLIPGAPDPLRPPSMGPPASMPQAAPEINKTWLVLGVGALVVILLAVALLLGGFI